MTSAVVWSPESFGFMESFPPLFSRCEGAFAMISVRKYFYCGQDFLAIELSTRDFKIHMTMGEVYRKELTGVF